MKLKALKRLRFDEVIPLTFPAFVTNIVFGYSNSEVLKI